MHKPLVYRIDKQYRTMRVWWGDTRTKKFVSASAICYFHPDRRKRYEAFAESVRHYFKIKPPAYVPTKTELRAATKKSKK